MPSYLVAYSLNHPDSKRAEAEIRGAVKTLSGAWFHHFEGFWIVSGPGLTAGEITRKLSGVLKLTKESPYDTLLVVDVGHDVAGWLPEAAGKWLHDSLGQP